MVTLPARTDEELITSIASGDRGALGELYDRTCPSLVAQAQRILRNPIEAEDLVHDVYLEVWLKAHTYTERRGTVRTWLSVRLRSRALDRLKLAHNARRSSEDVNDLAESIGSEPELGGVDGDVVRRALATLPPDQRTVIELFYLDGLSLTEIGKKLMVPLGTIKSRASRAVNKLRQELRPAPTQ